MTSVKLAACDGKRRLQERTARRVARIMRAKGSPQHAYPCPHCRQGAWHVGEDWDR